MGNQLDRNTRWKGRQYDGTDQAEEREIENLFGDDKDDDQAGGNSEPG